jgi:hypothetical protein
MSSLWKLERLRAMRISEVLFRVRTQLQTSSEPTGILRGAERPGEGAFDAAWLSDLGMRVVVPRR